MGQCYVIFECLSFFALQVSWCLDVKVACFFCIFSSRIWCSIRFLSTEHYKRCWHHDHSFCYITAMSTVTWLKTPYSSSYWHWLLNYCLSYLRLWREGHQWTHQCTMTLRLHRSFSAQSVLLFPRRSGPDSLNSFAALFKINFGYFQHLPSHSYSYYGCLEFVVVVAAVPFMTKPLGTHSWTVNSNEHYCCLLG